MKIFTRSRVTGYTLLEMSVVLIVVGIVIASAASVYSLYLKNKAIMDTANNVNIVMNAVSNYFIQNGKYPCPARLDAQRSDADYGMPTDCTDTSVAPGNCSGGICVEQRAATIATLVPPKPRVRRGAVPFRILNKPEYVSRDGYNARLEYAVTEILTETTTYNKDHGAISVVDGQSPPRSVVKDDNTIHFIVLSHGPDREGAYSSNGVLMLPCGTGADAENCNTSPPNKDAIYRMAQTTSASGADHFDDLVKFFSTIETPLWTVADPAGTNIRDASLAKQVAIAQNASVFPASDPTMSVDVAAHARADGNLMTGQLCNLADADCFPPSLVGGADPNMACPNALGGPGPYISGVGNNHVTCSTTVEVKCPPGQVMKGITAGGSLICTAPPASCSAMNISVCAPNDDSLPATASGAPPITTVIHGDSKQDTYTCLSNGTWSLTSTTGICNCTPAGPSITYLPCQGGKAPSQSCWTGLIERTYTKTCLPMTETTIDDTSACVCADCNVLTGGGSCSTLPSSFTNPGDATSDGLPFPSGYVGSVNYTRNWVCSSATAGSFVSKTYVDNNPVCTCNTSMTPLTQTVACTVAGCDATGAWDFNGQDGCTAGFAGAGKYVNQKKIYDCSTGTYPSNWTNTANTCSCDPTLTMADPTPCPVGYSGTINRTRTFDCVANDWGAPVNDLSGSPPSTCTPISWHTKGSSVGSGSSTSGYVQAGTGCAPVNNVSNCYIPQGATNDYYLNCVCE